MVLEKNVITFLSTKGKSQVSGRKTWINFVLTKKCSHLRLVFSKYLTKLSEVKGCSRLAVLCRSNRFKDMNYYLSLFVL